MKRLLILTALLGSAPFAASATCTNPFVVKGLEENPSVVAASTTETTNYGVYGWDESVQGWVIIEEFFVPEAENDQVQTSDYLIPQSAMGGGVAYPPRPGPGPGNPPKHQQGAPLAGIAACDEPPKTLPTVIVTGIRPSGSTSGIYSRIWTTIRNVFSRNQGGGAHGREVSGGVKQADQSLTCASGGDELQLGAMMALKPFRRGLFMVRYGGGDFQMWSITQPTFSDGGIQPVGTCVDR